jgi:CubicO group peptidase (beta-lactamase class C family)
MSALKNQAHELFDKAVKASGAVGLQLSLITDGKQLDFVYGFANAELAIPMAQDTIVQVGSVTKVFNAMMIMSLVEEGRLDLDRPVKSYIPEFEVSDREATQAITLRHLLSMSSGLDNGDYADYGAGQDAIAKRVAALKTVPQHFRPGEYFGYSNAGSDVAGYVAERVTGRVWDDLLKERVLVPAGLKNAVSLVDDRMFQRVSVGHALDPQGGEPKVIRPWTAISRGAGPSGGTLTASAHDLAWFGKLFLSRGIADSGTRVLSENSIQAMMTPQIDCPEHYSATSWCLGPCISVLSKVPVWSHWGGSFSGMSMLYWVPEKKGVMACTLNTPDLSVFNRLAKVVTQDIMTAAFGVAIPEIKAPTSPINIDPKRYVGTYEALVGQCRVEAANNHLVMTTRVETTRKFGDTVSLIPLGRDRFLRDKGAQTDPRDLPQDLAFFGDDGHGRASNISWWGFPLSRTS